MRSALECFNQALQCEEMARATRSDIDRRMLLAAADIWRSLGAASKEAETKPHHLVEWRPFSET
jgi:hypothetical protein